MADKGLKIACVDNMNNTMFAVTRHLRHLGYNAELILSNGFSHFDPEADTFEPVDHSYIRKFDFLKTDILFTDQRAVHQFFFDYDVVIACGYSVAYLTFSKVKVDIVIPYGSDLYDLPFFEVTDPEDRYFNEQRAALARYQKKGIEQASSILFDYTNDDFEQIIKKFNLTGKRYKYPCPFIYTPEFNVDRVEELRSQSPATAKMSGLRNKFDFIAFNHIRQSWKNPLDIWSYKGNERIFRAFKSFLAETQANACLVAFEYGSDIADSKELVRELGLEKNITWFPISQRKDILVMITYSDVGIGEVGDYSWFSYGAIFEFLCMKKPVIHHRNDSLYKGKVESLYPMYSAMDEDMVLQALKQCYADKAGRAQVAEASHAWYLENAIKKPLQVLLQTIGSKNKLLSKIDKHAGRMALYMQSAKFYIKLKLR